jgi:membrane carboxypeptidase/penicillin-binding protein
MNARSANTPKRFGVYDEMLPNYLVLCRSGLGRNDRAAHGLGLFGARQWRSSRVKPSMIDRIQDRYGQDDVQVTISATCDNGCEAAGLLEEPGRAGARRSTASRCWTR